jgi:hypothetical protein
MGHAKTIIHANPNLGDGAPHIIQSIAPGMIVNSRRVKAIANIMLIFSDSFGSQAGERGMWKGRTCDSYKVRDLHRCTVRRAGFA